MGASAARAEGLCFSWPYRRGYDRTQVHAELDLMESQDHSSGGESTGGEAALVAAAVAGDRVALERLLLAHYDGLARQVAARLPARLQATQAVEDILQLTFCQAF